MKECGIAAGLERTGKALLTTRAPHILSAAIPIH